MSPRPETPTLALVNLERIEVDASVMAGRACIRGTRIPVTVVVGMLADGMSVADVIADFPQLDVEDVRAALRYASLAADGYYVAWSASA